MMLYNGVDLPDIDSVWTDKVTYPYATIAYKNPNATGYEYYLIISDVPTTATLTATAASSNQNAVILGPCTYKSYVFRDSWISNSSGNKESDERYNMGLLSVVVWSNTNVLYADGSVYLAASDPITPNAPSGTIEIQSSQILDDSASFVVSVSDLSSTESVYAIKSTLYSGGSEVKSAVTKSFSGPSDQLHATITNLTPETAYDITFILQENGTDTTVTASTSFTTLAAEEETPVDETETLSLLSAILDAVTAQNDFLDAWYQVWFARMNYLQNSLLTAIEKLGLSEQEAALKESTKETTQAVNDALFAEDAPTKVTVDDVTDVAQVGSAAAQMFNPGVGVGALFDALNDVSFLSIFSQEMIDDMNTTNSVSAFSVDSGNSTSYYDENWKKITDFVKGG